MSMVVALLPFVLFVILSFFGGLQHGWKIIAITLSLLLLTAPSEIGKEFDKEMDKIGKEFKQELNNAFGPF